MKKILVIAILMGGEPSSCWAGSMVVLRANTNEQNSAPQQVSAPQQSSTTELTRANPQFNASSPQKNFTSLNQTLDQVLKGIAWVESRRGDQPWPWTLNVAGKPYYFIDRESAWNATQRLQKNQFDNFDIGLMQVNWHFHKHRFKNTWEALDPAINQRVAKTIVLEQWQLTGHLPTAIARYHSANPNLGIPYLQRVLEAINENNRRGY